jgi:hypothetical protein
VMRVHGRTHPYLCRRSEQFLTSDETQHEEYH